MDATQQVSSGTPEVSESYKTPEGASERLAELKSNREWVQARLKNGPSSREANEEDALLRIVAGVPLNPATAPVAGAMTAEQAKARLAEFSSDPAKRTRLLDGDLAAKKEFDYLTKVAASGAESTTATQPTDSGKPKTAAEARAMADQVPAKAEDYGELPFRHDDMPPPEGITEIQNLMHTAGLTRGEAQTMISFAANDAVKWVQMDEAARAEHLNDTLARFHKIHGDQAPVMETGARRLIAEITAKDGGRLRQILLETGAGASLAVWNAVAAAARRRYGA